MLTLYKRCFPKWSSVWDGQLPASREEEKEKARITEIGEDGDDVEMA